MSDTQLELDQNDQTTDERPTNELDLLKMRARAMGISFSGNIGLDALKAKVNAKLNDEPEVEEPKADVLNPLAGDDVSQPVPMSKMQYRQRKIDEAMKLVRLRITNLDPKKKDLPGEIICIGNEIIGTVRKYVPFGETTDEGYHVPHVIYQELEARRFLNIRVVKDRITKRERVETNWAKEFALDVLPQLTTEELAKLAAAQTAAGSLND